MRRPFRHLDPGLLIAFGLLAIVGLFVIYSTTADTPRESLFMRHVVSLCVGLVVFMISMLIPYRLWETVAYVLYAVGIVALIYVLIGGSSELGAQRWILLGPVRIQPSEAAKIVTLLAVARLLASKREDPTRAGTVAKAIGLVMLPAALILRQPDLGTALAFFALGIAALFWAGTPFSWLLYVAALCVSGLLTFRFPLVAGAGESAAIDGGMPSMMGFIVLAVLWAVLLFVVAVVLIRKRASSRLLFVTLALHLAIGVTSPTVWNRLEPYQQNRVLTFLNPGGDPTGAGYQVIQSQIAIGSGGMTGKGYLRGTQKALAYLPQQHTDFAFSVLGEEKGFWCSAGVVGLFLLLLLRGVRIARQARDRYASLLAAGAVGLLTYHVFVNLFMTMGLAPVTGLPMPFISYGGSFLVVTMCLVGILQGVALRRHSY